MFDNLFKENRSQEYKYGFQTDVDTSVLKEGLSEEPAECGVGGKRCVHTFDHDSIRTLLRSENGAAAVGTAERIRSSQAIRRCIPKVPAERDLP